MTYLEKHPYANCHVVSGHVYLRRFSKDGKDLKTFSVPIVRFYSYTTVVAEIVGPWLYVYGTYSVTTSKHLHWFFMDYAENAFTKGADVYHTYKHGVCIDIHTGDAIKLTDLPTYSNGEPLFKHTFENARHETLSFRGTQYLA